MAKALVVKTQFTAIDGLTSVVKKMTAGVTRFGKKSVATMHKVDRATTRMRKGIAKSIGKFGQLGLAVSGAALFSSLLAANVEVDKSLASLSAISGVTGEAFKEFTKEIEKVSKAQKVFSADTAKAFELVGSAKPELLSSASALAEVTNNAITLKKASGDDLASSVANLTNVLNQFELGADQSARAMNVLAAASVVGDTTITQTSQAFKVAGSEAKMSGLNIEELSGAIATFSKFGFKGAEAGTKFRNILSKMSLGEALPKDALKRLKTAGVDIGIVSDKTVPFMKRLKELSKIQDNSAALAKVFGEENKGVAAILLSNLPLLEQNIKGVTGTSAATDQAAIKSNTLSNKWDEMIASFKNTTTSTNQSNVALTGVKKLLGFLADNMSILIPTVFGVVAAFTAFKVVMIAVNAAMYANPAGIIVAVILVLIAAIAALVIWWEEIVTWVKTSDNVFAKLIRAVLTPLLLTFKIIGLIIEWMIDRFKLIVEWVRTSDSGFAKFLRGSIEAGIKAFRLIGDVLSWLGEKWNEMIEWISTSDSGFAKFIREALAPLIAGFEYLGTLIDEIFGTGQSKLTLEQQGVNAANLSNEQLGLSSSVPEAEANKIRTQQIEKLTTQNSKVDINVNDKSGLADVTQDLGTNVNLTKTLGWQ